MLARYLYPLVRPLLFSLDPETVHHLTLPLLQKAARLGLTRFLQRPKTDPCTIMGIDFPNRVGLAAGLDKDGMYIDGLASLGFGFLEIGTVTPQPQPGNVLPRMFRLPEAGALINRMGFNNGGVDAFVKNVEASAFHQNRLGILGLNIGKNATTPIERAVDDYLICLDKVYPYADYVTVNISSPNTSNLRQLQDASELDSLLLQLKDRQLRLSDKVMRYVPIVLKIAPDLSDEQIKVIAGALIRHKMDGVIATNTTIDRTRITGLKHAEETGGLSGAPVNAASTAVIKRLKRELGETIPIIGVGGIMNGNDAQDKIDAGSSLVQLYTGLIYKGPRLIGECVDMLKKSRR